MTMIRRASSFFKPLTVLLTFAAAVHAVPVDADLARGKPKLVVIDIELTGDLGGPQFEAQHDARLRMESDTLRQQLKQSGLYTIIDVTPALPLIARLKSQQSYLHDCNGCDLEIGKQLGADQVLVTWVDRVSGLILSLTYEFHDVTTSQILGRKSYDFRGDNDSSWTHAVKYMVRDLKETAAAREATCGQTQRRTARRSTHMPARYLARSYPARDLSQHKHHQHDPTEPAGPVHHFDLAIPAKAA